MPAHTEIIVDTNQFAGHFQREMSAWVFGVTDDLGTGGAFMEEYNILPWASETLVSPTYGPNCYTWEQLAPTPGRVGDDGKTLTFSVRWCFGHVLSDGKVEQVSARLHSFIEAWNASGDALLRARREGTYISDDDPMASKAARRLVCLNEINKRGFTPLAIEAIRVVEVRVMRFETERTVTPTGADEDVVPVRATSVD